MLIFTKTKRERNNEYMRSYNRTRSEYIICDCCGRMYKRYLKYQHNKTLYHKKILNLNQIIKIGEKLIPELI